jgi:hypothetical protein
MEHLWDVKPSTYLDEWPLPEHVTATKIGIAVGREAGEIVCSSFHAG